MHRREFIAGVGFTALSAPALASHISQPPQPPLPPPATPPLNPLAANPHPLRKLKKAVGIGMVEDPAAKTTLDKFQLLRDCGFEGIEIDWPGGGATPLDEFAQAQEKTGLKIHGLVDSQHWKHTLNHGSPEVRKKGLDALCDCLRTAKTLGAYSVLLVPGVVNSDNSYEDCWRLSQEQIELAIPVAQETGVQIAVENVWNGFLLSPLEAARYIDDLNPRPPTARTSPIAFHFDIGNIINAGWPHHWVKTLGNRIVKLHIKDFSRKKRDNEGLWKGFDVELGDGDAQWAKVMAALDETGYSMPQPDNTRRPPPGAEGWATAEVGGGDRKRLMQVSQQMDALFKM